VRLACVDVEYKSYRDIDFSQGKRGPVIAPEPGKTKISIRLDNVVLNHFAAWSKPPAVETISR